MMKSKFENIIETIMKYIYLKERRFIHQNLK